MRVAEVQVDTNIIRSLRLYRRRQQRPDGEAYGLNLVYSGSFIGRADVDQYGTTRVAMGIHPFDFTWQLAQGESFQTPEVVMVYSAEGLGEMSRTYHRLYRERLCRGVHRDQVRPIKVNNWEATYFNFNAEKLSELGTAASELGIEMFVLDDGWFGQRDSDNSSLGDWVVDRHKLPDGLEGVYQDFNSKHLKFGLWFEPEMISPDSDLYRTHPDWYLHVAGRRRTEGRKQLVPIVLFGDLYWIVTPTDQGRASWMYVSQDQSEAVWTYVSSTVEANAPIPYVRLQGLDPARQYEVIETGQIYDGDELMYAGVPVQIPAQDFASVMWRLKAV